MWSVLSPPPIPPPCRGREVGARSTRVIAWERIDQLADAHAGSMRSRCWCAIALGSLACVVGGCTRSGGGARKTNRAHADQLATELARRTVPPQALQLASVNSDGRPCVIGREWSFVTGWSSDEYRQWLRSHVPTDFKQLAVTDERMTYSRYDQGEAHSITVESRPATDGLRVRIRLCVFPD